MKTIFTLQRLGGLSALVCGATYLIGFAFLITHLAPMGYGTADIDTRAVVAFSAASPSIFIAWNTAIYIINALALAVLVAALAQRLSCAPPSCAAVTKGIGFIWAGLLLAAGMIANVAVEQAGELYRTDPEAAATLWHILHSVELGLGGGNEIVGGVWIACVSSAGWIRRCLGKRTACLGALTGASGILTLIPMIGDAAGAVFGLGAIAWFIAIGVALVFRHEAPTPQASMAVHTAQGSKP
ncbi:hypothetical protein [Meridianimarinicoccus aquatilis]|uniref:hypothetical protein n=1 Tax=Meridianimarinicoccus aquatilis TaxID=2552766 RepID=UPI001FB58936|nr:hypothetical protein [Fluviibacterium aquatile]